GDRPKPEPKRKPKKPAQGLSPRLISLGLRSASGGKQKPKTKPRAKSPLKKNPPRRRMRLNGAPVRRRGAKKSVEISVPIEVINNEDEPAKTLTRRNALDLRKEVEKVEEEMQEKEKKWDIPAFLRRKPQENKSNNST
ncbi:MAG: hypothetical protein AAB577_02700, partial [Patescibacteria group bacterium]